MEANNTTKQRILIFIKYKGISTRKFETMCGFGNGSVNNTDFKKLESLKKILTAFPELNQDWLLFGEGEMLNTSQNVGDINNSNVSGVNVHGNDIQINPNAYDTLLQIVQTFQHSTTKSQEQIDRLITLLEKKYG
jgi:hypothetical protein